MKAHGERKHSKYAASAAERWFRCSGSVELSEGVARKDSIWSREGTLAHEVLEVFFRRKLNDSINNPENLPEGATREMMGYALDMVDFVQALSESARAEILVEGRVYLDFIHPEAFGTYDACIVDHFGTLHVFDYKYGAGHAVSPVENLQMIFYALGLAHRFQWNFKRVRLWIVQPRIKGYDGPAFWEIGILELKSYVKVFEDAIERVLKNPDVYTEGKWCHWCPAKGICPLKYEAKLEKAKSVFSKVTS